MNRNILFTEQNYKDIGALAKDLGVSVNKAVNLALNAYFGRPTKAVVYEPKEIKEENNWVTKQPQVELVKVAENKAGFSLFAKPIQLQNFDGDSNDQPKSE